MFWIARQPTYSMYIPNNSATVKRYLYSDADKIEHVNTNAFF